jgi:hypothetical protein
MMDGQISEEDIMRLMESEEGQAILQEIMASEGSGEAVGGGHVMPGTRKVMSGPSHEAYLEQGSTGLIGDGSELPGDVPMDKSAQDYTGPPTASEFDVPSVETGAVDPMTPESLEKRRMIEEYLQSQRNKMGNALTGR